MALTLGGRGYACYPAPEDAALVMASLLRHARYIRGEV
jgi:hypothetical protein